ncbi:GTPase Era [Candidatus Pantoea edessiphila]|uniref:GTPase Era n=1 Tax=Candidatus Pantoea edessiphila TaxID=2044610 RepID=A0A2P5T2Y1_9GAMM|nr:GTPase Era [Candidatus Pantoea edessiphila]PPI88937.1 GTPase Era [Candidatus Pantoea edessiphila]
MNNFITHCGFVAIVGRSNVGKSTLINKLLGKKISITSYKSQTTRNLITGIYTEDKHQIIYLDTPGLDYNKNKSNKANFIINNIIEDINFIILVVEAINWTKNDEILLNKLSNVKSSVILAINKIDKIKNKNNLLSYIDFLSKKRNFLEIIPISAQNGENTDTILKIIKKQLPQNEHYYPREHITTCSERFIASEIIREKLLHFLRAELPYKSSIEIKKFVINKKKSFDVSGNILVKYNSQKKIIVGNRGSIIKIISTTARLDMEKIFKTKVNLYLWVKVYS